MPTSFICPNRPPDPDCLTLFKEALVPVCAPGLGNSTLPLAAVEDLVSFALLHRSADRHDWVQWLSANGGKSLEDYRHIPFNLDELALDAAARGLGVAMTDRTLAGESIERGVLVMNLQPSAAAHPACALILQWFAQQAEKKDGER